MITVTLDRARTLSRALDSVRNQDFSHQSIEHIIIDGGSSDNTAAVVRERAPGAVFVSEPDRGIYDAINKGLSLASGQVIVLLNDDDLLPRSSLSSAYNVLVDQPHLHGLAGRFQIRLLDESLEIYNNAEEFRPAATSLEEALWGVPGINAMYLRRHVYVDLGGFSPGYPVAADREFLIRLFATPHYSIAETEALFYIYQSHADSRTIGGTKNYKWLAEQARMAAALMSAFPFSADQRRQLRRWHATRTAVNCAYTLKEENLRSALRFGMEQMVAQPLWPVRYVLDKLRRLIASRRTSEVS